ncbi:MAG: ATP-dependent DNA helicase DinG [Gammaproteobacteria bacterium]|nr:ATP-dependent DNA helicase DinG [Gammaproteobacteria bacterium]
MLNDVVKQTIQGAYSNWLAARGLKPRAGQSSMIAHVANALARSGDPESGAPPICVVEAGTGTGKTIAYAVAAIPIARALGKKLVVSTATVALQEQLAYRDFPDLQAAGALDFSFALAKGRGRYACTARLDSLLRGAHDADESQLALMDELVPAVNAEARSLFQALYGAVSDGSWAGDRDSWPDALPDGRWAMVTTDHHQCSGRRCSYVAQCPFFSAREGLDSVDCIVANHDLVLADIALGGGAVLPAPEDTIYVFDEAHHLPDKARNQLSFHARIGLAREHIAECRRLAGELIAEPRSSDTLRRRLSEVPGLGEEIDLALGSAGALLQPLLVAAPVARSGVTEYRLPHGRVPAEIAGVAAVLHNALAKLGGALGGAEEELARQLELGGAAAQSRYALLGLMIGRIERLLSLWRAWAEPDRAGEPPQARWIRTSEQRALEDIEVAAAPVLAANLLRESIWERACGAVLTSATLTALGSFDRIILRAGLPDDSVFATVPSPFDYQGRACLAVPRLAADPGDPLAHTREVGSWLDANLDLAEASLVLFASRKQMRDVYDRVCLALRDRILLQDHFTKQELLRLHRERVEAGAGSVIFGLASFAEGIDLPGGYCMHVVIAKLPFAVPDEPVEAALAEWVESRGGNPFMEISVPDAALRLVQASGRLLRTEEDTGRITLLDRRVITRAYGRKILDSLPPFRREVA